jgi:hypothetical protein
VADGARIALCQRLLPFAKKPMLPLAQLFEELGYQTRLIGDDPSTIRPDELLFIWGSIVWYPRIRGWLVRQLPADRPTSIIWHTEPLPPPSRIHQWWPLLTVRQCKHILTRDGLATDVYTNYWALRALARLRLPDILIVGTRGRQEFLCERDIRAEFVPIGYSRDAGWDMGIERDIDVMFIGAPGVERTRRLITQLRRRGVVVTRVGSWSDPSAWGLSRTVLLNRTKILLNLARTRLDFSDYRFVLGMANKALVISEPTYRPDPYLPGSHFVMSENEHLPAAIDHYLAADSDRLRIVDAALAFVTTEVTLSESVKQIHSLIETRTRRRSTGQ